MVNLGGKCFVQANKRQHTTLQGLVVHGSSETWSRWILSKLPTMWLWDSVCRSKLLCGGSGKRWASSTYGKWIMDQFESCFRVLIFSFSSLPPPKFWITLKKCLIFHRFSYLCEFILACKVCIWSERLTFKYSGKDRWNPWAKQV